MFDRDDFNEDWEMKFRDEYHNFISLKFLGSWWIPDDSENKIYGTLEIIRGKETYLNLIGSFRKNDDNIEHHDIIYGLSSDGKKITLSRCIEKYYSSSPNGLSTSIYEISVSFIGAHFSNINEALFSKIKIRYPYIDEWINHNFYTGKYIKHDKFILQYNKPPEMKFLVGNGYTLSFEFDIVRPPMLKIIREPYMHHVSFVVLQFMHPTSFEEIIEITTHIKYLLSFAINRPINAIMMEGIINRTKENNLNKISIFNETKTIPKKLENILHTLIALAPRM